MKDGQIGRGPVTVELARKPYELRFHGTAGMGRHYSLLFSVVMIAAVALASAAPAASPGGMQFAEGQVWSIKSTSPTTTRVIVGRVEPWGDRVAVHVSALDVPRPAQFGGEGTMAITHMPFDEAALRDSVEELLGSNAPPVSGFEDGYREWKAAKGGIFTIGVSEAIDAIFFAFEHGEPVQ